MAKENNFTKAVKELLGEKEPSEYERDYQREPEQNIPRSPSVVSVTEKEEESYLNVPTYTQPKSTGATNIGAQTTSYNVRPKSAPAVTPKPQPTPPPPPPPPPPSKPMPTATPVSIVPVNKPESTFINSDTIITGNISSKTDIRNDGKVTGDIFTEENVCITGNVDGNVEGKSVQIIGGYVVGNITAKVDVLNDFDSIIIGDVTGENFLSDGKVKGNIKITNAVSLKSNAVIAGNVSASKINVQDGAIIKGNVQIISNVKINEEEVFAKPSNRMGQTDMFDMPAPTTTRIISNKENTDVKNATVEIFDDGET